MQLPSDSVKGRQEAVEIFSRDLYPVDRGTSYGSVGVSHRIIYMGVAIRASPVTKTLPHGCVMLGSGRVALDVAGVGVRECSARPPDDAEATRPGKTDRSSSTDARTTPECSSINRWSAAAGGTRPSAQERRPATTVRPNPARAAGARVPARAAARDVAVCGLSESAATKSYSRAAARGEEGGAASPEFEDSVVHPHDRQGLTRRNRNGIEVAQIAAIATSELTAAERSRRLSCRDAHGADLGDVCGDDEVGRRRGKGRRTSGRGKRLLTDRRGSDSSLQKRAPKGSGQIHDQSIPTSTSMSPFAQVAAVWVIAAR